MRNLRPTCAVILLVLMLAVSAFAGQINCPGAPEPVPPTQSSVITTVVLAIVSLVR
jgi:hypothetical protein